MFKDQASEIVWLMRANGIDRAPHHFLYQRGQGCECFTPPYDAVWPMPANGDRRVLRGRKWAQDALIAPAWLQAFTSITPIIFLLATRPPLVSAAMKWVSKKPSI